MDYLPKRRLLWHGPPKSGKSLALQTVPKGSSLYYIDADRQAGGLVKGWKKRFGSLKDLKIIRVPYVREDTKEMKQAVFQEMRKIFWNPPSGYDFYAIDSYTRITLNLTHCTVGKGERHYNEFNNQQLSSAANDFWFQFNERIEYISPNAWVITIMHEKWEEIDDGTSTEEKRKPKMIVPKCGTSAETAIPANCDFVWHVEKGRRVFQGKSRSVTLFRTAGTPTIMASSVGFEDELEDTEVADLSVILPKLGLPEVAEKKKIPSKVEKEKSKWQK